eukprot:1885972-Pyramimonas_sp.AAC.1
MFDVSLFFIVFSLPTSVLTSGNFALWLWDTISDMKAYGGRGDCFCKLSSIPKNVSPFAGPPSNIGAAIAAHRDKLGTKYAPCRNARNPHKTPRIRRGLRFASI